MAINDGTQNFQPGNKWKPVGGHIPKRSHFQLVSILKAHQMDNSLRGTAIYAREKHVQDQRERDVLDFFTRLFHLKFRIDSVHNIKQKHLLVVFSSMAEQGISPATIKNSISSMRTFCEWIGKHGMVMEPHYYLKEAASAEHLVEQPVELASVNINGIETLVHIRPTIIAPYYGSRKGEVRRIAMGRSVKAVLALFKKLSGSVK